MQGYCDVYKRTILKRTSPEVKCLHPTSSRREMCTSSVSNVIYHKFSHGAAFYTLNGKNVNVMLEYYMRYTKLKRYELLRDMGAMVHLKAAQHNCHPVYAVKLQLQVGTLRCLCISTWCLQQIVCPDCANAQADLKV